MFAKIISLSLLTVALAQSSNGTASMVDIEGVEANFQNAELVPGLLSTFSPMGLLDVSYGGATITTGQNLTQDAVASYPSLSFVPASNATGMTADAMYTLMLVDANPVGTDETMTEQTRHWLVNGASLTMGSSAPYDINYNGSTAITDYTGPGPFAGSGSHRYCLLLYSQPSSFMAPANLSTAGTALGTFFLSSYVQDSGLGDLVAANYFQVENGVASMTVAATSAVVSSTLAGFASSTATASMSGSMTGSMSGTMTGSSSGAGSGTASAAASTSSMASSGGRLQLGWAGLVGALGIAGTIIGAGLGF